jgi:ATP-dependent RNA helicase DHX8/PRP22
LKVDPQNRSLCPRCNVGIEKNGGCMHVECRACHSHICWRCKKHFEDSASCYGHLRIAHGGYM